MCTGEKARHCNFLFSEAVNMGDEFDDVEAMLEAPFRKDAGGEVRKCSFNIICLDHGLCA